jgi:hypothetical protein
LTLSQLDEGLGGMLSIIIVSIRANVAIQRSVVAASSELLLLLAAAGRQADHSSRGFFRRRWENSVINICLLYLKDDGGCYGANQKAVSTTH